MVCTCVNSIGMGLPYLRKHPVKTRGGPPFGPPGRAAAVGDWIYSLVSGYLSAPISFGRHETQARMHWEHLRTRSCRNGCLSRLSGLISIKRSFPQ
jgi:hypothetical protein